ncbi:SCO family protein [Deinococcus detaillensis]|uniref:SCO family protein n=1 Tax=Deinococcus detaillensis TaxID=2592048 RepID=A0A553V3D2_9DEIO|nr:SCO family protein [Deinococcus detaillensis]TSA86741.1 SCO family protein [Deinococcus detaillensis]
MTEVEHTPTQPSRDGHASGSSSHSRPWYVSLLFALAAVALLLGGAWVYARLQSPFPFFGTAYTPPLSAPSLSGTDQSGNAYTFAPNGKTTALFFGFTHCPNICPLSLTYLNQLRETLPAAERQNFQIVFVSVDPQRDTPPLIKSYLSFFGNAVGVHIPEPQLAKVALSYGAAYTKADIKGPDDYQVNHTTATYLIDKQGKIRLLWDYTQLPQLKRLEADVNEVMR